MNDAEARTKSAAKVQQIIDLARTLQVTMEASQKVDLQSGLISLAVLFKDNEQYPAQPVDVVATEVAPAPAPVA